MRPATDLAAGVAGFVAAEGTFTRGADHFAFAVTLGATDTEACELLQAFFGIGVVRHYPRRRSHYDDEVVFVVRRLQDLVDVIVPFMDEHLPPTYKREQYEVWRRDLVNYWRYSARRRRRCSEEGCEALRRAKGLCRHHYYVRFRR